MGLFSLFRTERDSHGTKQDDNLLPRSEALIATPLTFLECGSEGAVAALDREGRAMVLIPSEASLLQAFRKPCLPEDIPARLRAQGWESDDFLHAQEILCAFKDKGLLCSIGSLKERSRAGPVIDTGVWAENAGYSMLAIPTQDRPEMLARALQSWDAVAKSDECNGLSDILIADDSKREAAATRSVAESFAPLHDGTTYFLDSNFRRTLAEALAPFGDRAATFALGLDGGVAGLGLYGAARNFILLSSAGRSIVMADDDMIPDFREHPLSLDGLALSSEPDPTIVRPFADRTQIDT